MGKINLSKETIGQTIEKLVNSQITDITELPQAKTNVAYLASTKDFGQIVIKLIFRPPINDQDNSRFVNLESKFQYLSKLGLNLPEIVYSDDIERKINNHTIYGIMIRKYIRGHTLDRIWDELDENKKIEIAKELGSIIRKIHTIKVNKFGFLTSGPQIEPQNTWRDQILTEVETYKEIIKDDPHINIELIKRSVKLIHDTQDIWAKNVDAPYLVHNDLWNANVIIEEISQGKYKFKCLIDWEWMIGGDPVFDFAYFNSPYLFRLLENESVLDVFYQSYGIDMEKENNRIKQYIYQMVQALLFLANNLRHEKDPLAIASQLERIRYAKMHLEKILDTQY